MTTETKKYFETVEELASWVLENTYRGDQRYKLTTNTEQEFDDPEAGKQWEIEMNSIGHVPTEFSEREEWWKKREEISDRRPSTHFVKSYYLWLSDNSRWSRHDNNLYLSPSLGEAIDNIWTKKEVRWRNGKENTGSLTLKGLLKRLGKTDFGKQFAEIEKAAKARDERNSRNYARKEIRDLAGKLNVLLQKHAKDLGINAGMDIAGLMAIEDEK